MDRAWIYRNIHLIISLVSIGTSEISSKENYCTKAGKWKEAMTNCTKSGGVPLTHLEVNSTTEFTLKDNITVWTADYIYLEDVTDIADVIPTNEYECGYRTFDYHGNRTADKPGSHEHRPRKGTQYAQCQATKKYFCHSTSTHLREGISTWREALANCSSYNSSTLWQGYIFNWNVTVNNVDIWINKARRVTHGIFNAAITIDKNNIETCGTSAEEVKRYNESNCKQHFESVCAFDQKVTDTETFTRTCFEEVYVHVTRSPFSSSTIDTSDDAHNIITSKAHHTTEVSTIAPDISADANDNNISTEHKGQADDSTDKVVTTIIASVTTFCILFGIGIGLFCYVKQRRRKFNENTTTVRYDNENLPTTTTDRNKPVNNSGVDAIADAADIDDQNYEECDAPSGINTMDDMYTTPEQHGEYSACHYAAAIPIEESEYDSTRNIKESEKTSNIYNTLGFEGAESVYDNGQFNKGKGLHVDSSTYSSFSLQDTTYDTTA